MSKHKHFKVQSSALGRTGNGPITPLGVVILPLEIEGIKLQVHVLTCDGEIPSVGFYLESNDILTFTVCTRLNQ